MTPEPDEQSATQARRAQQRLTCRRAAVRAVAVVRDHEFVRDFVGDGVARAAPSEHSSSLGVCCMPDARLNQSIPEQEDLLGRDGTMPAAL
jgi:hypothetical protein